MHLLLHPRELAVHQGGEFWSALSNLRFPRAGVRWLYWSESSERLQRGFPKGLFQPHVFLDGYKASLANQNPLVLSHTLLMV